MENYQLERGQELLKQQAELARRRVENEKSPNEGAGKVDTSILPQGADEGKDWGEVLPLPPKRPKVPPLPEEMVPASLLPWLKDLMKGACVPLEYIAVPVIIALTAVVGRKIGIRPEQYALYTVVPNLWGAIVGRPGAMKSYAISEALRPLRRLEEKARQAYQSKKAIYTANEEKRKLVIEATKKKLAKAISSKGDVDAISSELAIQIGEQTAPHVQRRYIAQDATVEKIGELLNENPNGLLLTRDELSGWLLSLDKPGREGDREFYLESWNGNDGYQVDRIGRGSFYIESNCLSVVGGIQPGKLQSFFAGGLQEDSKADDGFLQRLQLLIWPDEMPGWNKPSKYPSPAVKENAYAVYDGLDRLTPAEVGAQGKEGEIPYLTFSEAAQAVWDEWRNKLEQRLRKDEGTSEAFDSHLSKYRSLMPSLALLFHLVDVVSGTSTDKTRVGENPTVLAVEWCEYLELHALKLYVPTLQPEAHTAHLLAEKIRSGHIRDRATIRDIWKRGWSGLRDAETVKRGLAELEDCGWLQVLSEVTGGRPTTVVRLHPELQTPGDETKNSAVTRGNEHPKPPKAFTPDQSLAFGCFGSSTLEHSPENIDKPMEPNANTADGKEWEAV